MSNAKLLQSEYTSYSFSKPKFKLQKDFADLSLLIFGPLLPYNSHSNVCLFAHTWITLSPHLYQQSPHPLEHHPTLWSGSGERVYVCVWEGVGSVGIHLVEEGLVQVGVGLGLVRVGDGGCKGTKGQTLEGIEAGNWCNYQISAFE